jgi:hypothetical protein
MAGERTQRSPSTVYALVEGKSMEPLDIAQYDKGLLFK